VKDGLSPLLKKIETEADAIILGSPIYFGSITGEMRSFMERLLFAPLVYTKPPQSIFPRKIRTGIIYTMNVPGSTGFCGSINASEQEENIFEFSAKFMYIATDNENNLTRACYEGACASPFEALNGFQYHSNWLQNMQLCWS
jgi:multimeric flavodoxin WrbA